MLQLSVNMDAKKYVLERIDSGPLFKHMERDYSMFFLTAFGDAHSRANVPKYGNNGLTVALMIFRNLVSMYYRLEGDNEVLLANIANNISLTPALKDELFKNYSEAGDTMREMYDAIEAREEFDEGFIKKLSETITKLITYQVCILHRSDNFVKRFENLPGISDEIQAIRKKYESVFGLFETKFEVLCQKLLAGLPGATLLDLKHLSADELITLMSTGVVPKESIAARQKLVVISYLPKVEILTGPVAEEIYDAIKANEAKYHPTQNANNEIVGKTVYGTGKITGECQVITDYDQVETLETGKILVTPSTLPKYNQVYTRAKGIITNEGGILAHAAILCREFKIPGIIGTKIATNVLKTGDMVELDTEKGVIKIIK